MTTGDGQSGQASDQRQSRRIGRAFEEIFAREALFMPERQRKLPRPCVPAGGGTLHQRVPSL